MGNQTFLFQAMNPEIAFPEILLMKSSEMFVERAWIVRGDEIIKIPVRKIILKNERDLFARTLKESCNGDKTYLIEIFK